MSVAPHAAPPRRAATRPPRARRAPRRAANAAASRAGAGCVSVTKRLLPVVALALLATIALWPEFDARDRHAPARATAAARLMPQSGEMTDARYHGVDEQRPALHGDRRDRPPGGARAGQPDRARRATSRCESGTWLMVQRAGASIMQHPTSSTCRSDVVLYRDDGTTLATDAATVDLKAGAAAGADRCTPRARSARSTRRASR